MKRAEQEMHNEIAMDIYAEAMKEFHAGVENGMFYRLDNCQAYYIYTDNFILLKSYNTFVAMIDQRTGELADVLRMVYGYTTTSAKHIAKFRNKFSHTHEFTARPL
jgi:hypothetical protein